MNNFVNIRNEIWYFIRRKKEISRQEIIENFIDSWSQSTTSRRLTEMEKKGQILYKKKGVKKFYRINPEKTPDSDLQDKIDLNVDQLQTLSYKQQETQCEIYDLNDEFRAKIYANLKENIKIAGKKPYFSDLMNEHIHSLIDSLLINGFLLNPDLWYSLKNPEDFKFEIKLEVDLSESPNTIKKLKNMFKHAVDLKFYPDLETKYSLFDPDEFAGDPFKSSFIQTPIKKYSWKDYIGDRTLKELRDRALGEHKDREEKIVNLSEGVDELGDNFMVLIKKEKKYSQKDPQKLKILENSKNALWKGMYSNYIRTFEKDFGIDWIENPIEFNGNSNIPIILPIITIKNKIQFLTQEIDKMKNQLNQSIDEYLKHSPKESLLIFLDVILTKKISLKNSVSELSLFYIQKLESLKEVLGKYEKK